MTVDTKGARVNPVKQKLADGRPVLGIWSIISAPAVVEVIALGGMDFVILDMEHGVFDVGTVESCTRACEAAGAAPLVRLPGINPSSAQWALDVGSFGIVVPQVGNADQAEEVVRMAKYAPRGVRGYNPFTRAAEYSNPSDNRAGKLNNDFSLVCAIVESREGLDNLAQVCATPDLDVLYVGVYDLAVALGYSGDTTNPDLVRVVEDAVGVIRRSGKAAGMMVKSQADIERALSIGANFLVYSVDTFVLRSAVNTAVVDFEHAVEARVELRESEKGEAE